ncbi:RNA polymerase sigma factor [Nocardioides speluncae]|uniref:RNA polymerase sigma factor n=1 Tax=Nocardioides speluncae TaxID=2670337 RepID=UPI000D69907F|nr:RNA polymerase sigma factor [Nocardioides speluncae]
MSVDDLILRAKDGDPQAWRELYAAHAGRLVVWLRTLPTGDTAVAPDDLAAEAWLTAAEKIAGFSGSRSEFAGWLFGIARLLATNARRRSNRRATSPSDLLHGHASDHHHLAPVPDVGHQVIGEEWVRGVLADLPRREREVVACMDVVGLDVEGTAVALGMSRTAVRVARHRALTRLRRTVVLAPS